MIYQHARTTVFNIGYHLVWSTKYRRKVLVGPVEQALKGLLMQTAVDHGFQFQQFPHLRRYLWGGKLWNPSTFVESIGHISEATVRRYIEDQKAA